MSTRASILVKEDDDKCYVYHHCDGYPSGIGVDMQEYLKTVKYWTIENIVNDLIKAHRCGTTHNIWTGESKIGDDGYEWTTCIHGDEEYFYLIDCDKKELHCYTNEELTDEVKIEKEDD